MGTRRIGIILALAAMTAGCGKTITTMNHTILPSSTFRKATPECTKASDDVFGLLKADHGFDKTHIIWLANGGCAVQVMLTDTGHGNITTILKDIYDGTKYFYSFIFEPRTPVNIWIDEPPLTFDPVKDTAGKILSTVPTDEDCNTVRDILNHDVGGGIYTTVLDKILPKGPKRCYVEAVFADDAPFMKMMTWSNNTSSKHEPFHYYLQTGAEIKVTKTIWIHIVRALPNQN